MSWMIYDPDAWEVVTHTESYGTFPGTNIPFGSSYVTHSPRSPEAIAKIKADRLAREEDEILTKAAFITTRRTAIATSGQETI